MAEMEKAKSQIRSINQAKLERKDAYYEAEKHMMPGNCRRLITPCL